MALAAVCLIVSLLAVPAVCANTDYSIDYIVEDSAGWSQGVDYEIWASRKRFSVGDNLSKYDSTLHNLESKQFLILFSFFW